MTASGTPAVLSCSKAPGDVSKLHGDPLIFAMMISAGKPAFSIPTTSLLVNPDDVAGACCRPALLVCASAIGIVKNDRKNETQTTDRRKFRKHIIPPLLL